MPGYLREKVFRACGVTRARRSLHTAALHSLLDLTAHRSLDAFTGGHSDDAPGPSNAIGNLITENSVLSDRLFACVQVAILPLQSCRILLRLLCKNNNEQIVSASIQSGRSTADMITKSMAVAL